MQSYFIKIGLLKLISELGWKIKPKVEIIGILWGSFDSVR